MIKEHILARYIQGIRRYCKKCKHTITPVLFITNDQDGITKKMSLRCDSCDTTIWECDLP